MSGPGSIVKQANLPDVLRDHNSRISVGEAQVGRWVYVIPIAPATEPPNYAANDPMASTPDGWGVFKNGWKNVASAQPVSFRIHPATKVQFRGAIFGGTIPSIVFTLPPDYRPTQAPAAIAFPGAGDSTFVGRVDMNGDVWVLAEVKSSTDDIRFYVNNQGGFLDITTNEVDASGIGMQFIDASGGGITINLTAGGHIQVGGDETDTIDIRSILGTTIEGGDFLLQAGKITMQGQAAIETDILTAGNTFTVKDHLGNPIFQLTG